MGALFLFAFLAAAFLDLGTSIYFEFTDGQHSAMEYLPGNILRRMKMGAIYNLFALTIIFASLLCIFMTIRLVFGAGSYLLSEDLEDRGEYIAFLKDRKPLSRFFIVHFFPFLFAAMGMAGCVAFYFRLADMIRNLLNSGLLHEVQRDLTLVTLPFLSVAVVLAILTGLIGVSTNFALLDEDSPQESFRWLKRSTGQALTERDLKFGYHTLIQKIWDRGIYAREERYFDPVASAGLISKCREWQVEILRIIGARITDVEFEQLVVFDFVGDRNQTYEKNARYDLCEEIIDEFEFEENIYFRIDLPGPKWRQESLSAHGKAQGFGLNQRG